MARPDRSERPLDVHPAVRAGIAQLLAVEHYLEDEGAPDALRIPDVERVIGLEAVLAAEEAVRGWFNDETLALLASDSRTLVDSYQMSLGLVGAHTDRAHQRGVRPQLLAIGNQGDLWLCVPRSPADEDRQRVVLVDEEVGSEQRVQLAQWLNDQVQQLLEAAEELDDAVVVELEGTENFDRFAPRIARTEPADRLQAPPRRVRHGKFGAGTVLRELDDGGERKLEVAFDGGSTKTLLARFLQDA